MSKVERKSSLLKLLICCQILLLLFSISYQVQASSLADGAVRIESLDDEPPICLPDLICLVSGVYTPIIGYVPPSDLTHGLIQFMEEPTFEQVETLKEAGVKLVYSVPYLTWYATFDNGPLSALDLEFVSWISGLQWDDKISHALDASQSERVAVTVNVWPNSDATWLEAFGEPTVLATDIYLIDIAKTDVSAMAQHEGVMWIDLFPETTNQMDVLLTNEWQLNMLHTSSLSVSNMEITLRFDGESVIGFGGCTNYIGKYALSDGQLTVSQIVESLEWCPDSSSTQDSYISALKSATTWRIDNDELRLEDADGRVVLAYTQGDPTAVSMNSITSNIITPQLWMMIAFMSLVITVAGYRFAKRNK